MGGARGIATPERAHGYLCLPAVERPEAEAHCRRVLAQVAHREGLELRSVFVDRIGEQPYGFAALCELLRRGVVQVLIVPDLGHLAHIPSVAHLDPAELARYLGVAVLLAAPTRQPPDGGTRR